MIESTLDLAKATGADRPAVVGTLTAGFLDDPVVVWMFPDRERRIAILPELFSVFAEAFARHDETYVVAGGVGVALWSPPGVAPIADENPEAFGEAVTTIVGPDADRRAAVLELLDAYHPEAPHWYLWSLSVEPAHHGRGIGSALLRAAIERCDRDGAAAYLEATSPRNRALYERHGFVVQKEFSLTDGPSLWAMWREPLS